MRPLSLWYLPQTAAYLVQRVTLRHVVLVGHARQAGEFVVGAGLNSESLLLVKELGYAFLKWAFSNADAECVVLLSR